MGRPYFEVWGLSFLPVSSSVHPVQVSPDCRVYSMAEPSQSYTGRIESAISVPDAFPVENVGVSINGKHARIGSLEVCLPTRLPT